uniref:L-19437 n=1 Tax=synthetic construct TaxID=32630 RepID=UPI002657644B|nr:Chain A, L-19437 [synthetic construct]7YH8_C Chain C, L-19437 [synthetic construct]
LPVEKIIREAKKILDELLKRGLIDPELARIAREVLERARKLGNEEAARFVLELIERLRRELS